VYEDIRHPGKLVHYPGPFGALEIEGDALLAVKELGRLQAGPAVRISVERLDLYHPGPQLGEKGAGEWTSDVVAGLDDCDAR
jgi:hypothetical protein